jgi:hypothetical protein
VNAPLVVVDEFEFEFGVVVGVDDDDQKGVGEGLCLREERERTEEALNKKRQGAGCESHINSQSPTCVTSKKEDWNMRKT